MKQAKGTGATVGPDPLLGAARHHLRSELLTLLVSLNWKLPAVPSILRFFPLVISGHPHPTRHPPLSTLSGLRHCFLTASKNTDNKEELSSGTPGVVFCGLASSSQEASWIASVESVLSPITLRPTQTFWLLLLIWENLIQLEQFGILIFFCSSAMSNYLNKIRILSYNYFVNAFLLEFFGEKINTTL